MKTYTIDEHVVAGKPLGRHVEHDERSRAFAFEAPAEVPVQSVLWPRVGAPFDQGNVGSCTGNATAGAVNTKPLHRAAAHPSTRRTLHEADALAIYGLATQLDGIAGTYPPEDTGSSGLAAAKAAQQLGFIGSYQHAFDMAAALQALMHGPVITGVAWYEGFDSPDASGLVAVSGQVRGGHEFEVRGLRLGVAPDHSDAVVVAENSWGTGWGVKGLFFFTVASWQRLLNEDGDVTILLP